MLSCIEHLQIETQTQASMDELWKTRSFLVVLIHDIKISFWLSNVLVNYNIICTACLVIGNFENYKFLSTCMILNKVVDIHYP
jgi:hypothetical protein